jgi:hypothetical protein
VLLIVLLVLTIAGAALAGAVRRSCRKALAANDAQRQLQQRWGVRSCRDTFLANAEILLAAGRETIRRETIILGGWTFHLVLSDEQCKADVNRLAQDLDLENLRRTLNNLQSSTGRPLPLQDDLAALQANPFDGRASRYYTTYDQVFRYGRPAELMDASLASQSPAGAITCWTDGRVNFKRAPKETVKTVLKGKLTDAQTAALLQFASQHPDGTLAEAIEYAELDAGAAAAAKSHLTDRSGCYGVWVIVETPRRTWYHFFVTDVVNVFQTDQTDHAGYQPGDGLPWTFHWQ